MKSHVMCLPFEELKTLKVPVLPDGYSYKMFEPGDEVAWANLEVLEQKMANEEKIDWKQMMNLLHVTNLEKG